ncbi:MAG: RNA methyltransferase [Acidobacteria bacterium]|uniref:RNA methyltransferase n=1 Tax=Candidatus Sulfomarinibacter kjeldsenii TaxID=2885994 RepID=A0A8J6Y5Y6_9BACT|nr:RNA methyltransferase [Candidatus Sulfomarinibacter kjeldsenii]
MADQNDIERLGRRGRRLKDLRKRVKSRRDGEVIVDGRRLISDLVRWGVPIRELYLVPEISGEFESMGWREAAESVFELESSVLADIAPTKTSQGVLAIAGEPEWPAWSAEGGVALWLDRIQAPGNVGAIVRSAAGLGAAGVLLSPGCADPYGAATVRGAAGAVFRIPIERNVRASEAIDRVKSAGGTVWATDSRGQKIDGWRPSEPCLLLVGAEGAGLDPVVAELADGTVAISMSRGIESLNVAVATGILLQHFRSV